jgi:hypothetical protein
MQGNSGDSPPNQTELAGRLGFAAMAILVSLAACVPNDAPRPGVQPQPSATGASRRLSGPPRRVSFAYEWCPYSCQQSRYHFSQYGGFPPDHHTIAGVSRDESQAAYANSDIFAASWWGRGHFTDQSVPLVLQANRALDDAGQAGTQHMKVSVYYEAEGNQIGTTPGSPNPSSAQLGNDLSYLMRTYVNGPNGGRWARVNGKPVLFVYGDGTDTCGMNDRWRKAPGVSKWFVVLKVFPGYATCPTQPDGWHQYSPAVAFDAQLPYSVSISPGFWSNTEPAPRLERNLTTWQQNVARMNAANVDFQFVTTLNEWNEGTGVGATDEWQFQYLDVLHAFAPRTG